MISSVKLYNCCVALACKSSVPASHHDHIMHIAANNWYGLIMCLPNNVIAPGIMQLIVWLVSVGHRGCVCVIGIQVLDL